MGRDHHDLECGYGRRPALLRETLQKDDFWMNLPYPQRTPGPLNETVAYDYTSQLSRLGKHSVAISVIQTHRTIQIANISHLVPVVISPPPRMRQLMQENLSKDLVIASISRRMESNMTQRDLVGSVLRTKFQDGIPSPDYLFTIQV
ncbi:hypothetical protein E4U37_007586 [Claviceps purpurea]|nr:hypothetical protein E4U37_007586 [Claviceps purpurea]